MHQESGKWTKRIRTPTYPAYTTAHDFTPHNSHNSTSDRALLPVVNDGQDMGVSSYLDIQRIP